MEYFYIIEHVSTGKRYAGSKYGVHSNPTTFMCPGGYTTSSVIVNEIIRNEGIDSFRIEYLTPFPDGGAHVFETKFLKDNDCAANNMWYNLHNNELFYSYEDLKKFNELYWGNANPFVTDKFKHKAKTTWLEKYGVDNPSKADAIKDKKRDNWRSKTQDEQRCIQERREQTCLSKYGQPSVLSSASPVRERISKTLKEKYGVNNVMHVPEIKERHKRSVEDTYNNVDRREEIVAKRRSTLLERTGFDSASKDPKVKAKRVDTTHKKYGVDYYSQTTESKHRKAASCRKRLGVDNPSQASEVKEKKKNKLKENYGEHPSKIEVACPICSEIYRMTTLSAHAKGCFANVGKDWVKPKNASEWKALFVRIQE